MKRLLAVIAAGTAAIVLAAPASAGLLDTHGVITGRAQTEYPAVDYQVIGGDETMITTWTRVQKHNKVHAFVSVGGHKTQLNNNSHGWTWGLDPNGYVSFQHARKNDSQIRLYDWQAGTFKSPGSDVNSRRTWEYSPSVSGDQLLFARLDWRARPDKRTVYLYDLSTHQMQRVSKTLHASYKNGMVDIGQLSGDWASWSNQRHHLKQWNVFRYQVSTRRTEHVPRKQGWLDYAPSITADGTLYFFRAHPGCGHKVHLMRWNTSQTLTDLGHLPKGYDVQKSFASSPRLDGSVEVSFDETRCTKPNFDVRNVQVVPPTAPNLTSASVSRQLASIGRPSRALSYRPAWLRRNLADHR